MKNYLLPALAFALLVTAPAFAGESSVSLDIVKMEHKKETIKDKCYWYSGSFGSFASDSLLNMHDKKISYYGERDTVTGYDKDGVKRITIIARTKCDNTSVEVKLYSQSGEGFKQGESVEIEAEVLAEKLKKTNARCPLNIYVNGNGTFKKAAFDCKVFSEDQSINAEPRMESGELLNAPAT